MAEKDPQQTPNFVLHTSPSGDIKVDVVLQDETIWMTQKAMGDLFGVESHTVTYHLKEIFSSGELSDQATTRKVRVVRQEGQREASRKDGA